MDRVDHWLREASRGMSPDAALAQPVLQLQGVGDEAAAALADAGIASILDLAASALFALARQVVETADGEGSLALLPLPSDLIDDNARGLTATAIAQSDLVVLRPVDAPLAARLQIALPAPTVRDLALWPPALNARRILQIAYGGQDPADDPEAPFELRPRMGRLPVERVQHEQLYFESLLEDLGNGDDIGRDAPPELYSLEGVDWPLDLTEALSGRGFERPGLGMQVTITQNWTPVGLALGHLLHSLALAPGEATRLAVVDWTRRVTAGTAEDIAENEALSNNLARQRSVSEVVDVVARELQQGRAGFTTTGAGWGIGGGVAGGVNGGDKQGTAALGFGYNRNDVQGSTMASSQGQRDLGSKLSQFVQDRSEQEASMARGRRASVVTEVSVSEAERLSTRVVANYNHMHALSVLYFEVVQIYRLLTEVTQVEPLLYLPIRPLDFENRDLVERYRGLLAEVALNGEARNALLGIPPAASKPAEAAVGLSRMILSGLTAANRPEQGNAALDDAGLRSALGKSAAWSPPTELALHSAEAALVEVRASGWHNPAGQPMGPVLSVLNRSSTLGVEPFGFKAWAQPRDKRYPLAPGQSDTPYSVDFTGGGMRLDELRSMSVGILGGQDKNTIEVALLFKRLDPRGRPVGEPVTLRGYLAIDGKSAEIPLLSAKFQPDTVSASAALPPFDLAAHLQSNALHYTMALLQRADPALLGLFLGRIKHGSLPLLSQIDPQPIAHVGNFLVFRWPAVRESRWWRQLLKARGLPGASRRESLVPMPTGGVFAEAVLGRFNSAEKLDLSRFWNWQDSPIPLTPSEIAPLEAGLRQGTQAPAVNPLGTAQLQQSAPLGMPELSVAVGKLAEIAGKGDSFRDMSGMNALLQQGGTAMTLAAQGARDFMSKAMDTVSAYGARVNEGKKIDDDKAAAAKQEAANKGASPGAASGASSGGSGGPGGAGASGPGPGGSAAPAAGKSTTPSPAQPSKREEAFLGPQPANPTPAADEAAKPGLLSLLVSVLPPEPKTSPILDLSGRLDMRGPYAIEIPNGDWKIQVQGGVGSLAARPTSGARATLVGDLIVSSFGPAQWDAAPGIQVPGLPAGWLDDRLDDLRMRSSINTVPMNSVILPGGSGDLEVDLDLRLQLSGLLMVRRQFQLLGLDETTLDALTETFQISLASRFAGLTATAAELDALFEDIVGKLVGLRRGFVKCILALRDTSTVWPILAASIEYQSGSQALEMTPRWALISEPTLSIRNGG